MSIILIDDCRFLIKAEDVPAELSNAEAAFFAASEADAAASWAGEPMAEAHMRAGGSVLIYTGSRGTVFGGYSDDELARARLVIPASAALCALKPDGVCVLQTGSCMSAVEFENGRAVRAGAFGFADEQDAEQARQNAFALAGIPAGAPFALYRIVSAKLKRGRVVFAAERVLDGAAEHIETAVPKKYFASAELRGAELLRASRRALAALWARRIAAACAALFAAWLCFWQVSLVLRAGDAEKSRARLSAIEPLAKQIEKRSLEISKLSNFAGAKMRPIKTLAYLNTLRPDSIAFDSVRQTGVCDVSITGTAPSITDVKAFVDAVNADKKYAAQMTSDASRGKTRFVITLAEEKK